MHAYDTRVNFWVYRHRVNMIGYYTYRVNLYGYIHIEMIWIYRYIYRSVGKDWAISLNWAPKKPEIIIKDKK
jgi:hypothetical protein